MVALVVRDQVPLRDAVIGAETELVLLLLGTGLNEASVMVCVTVLVADRLGNVDGVPADIEFDVEATTVAEREVERDGEVVTVAEIDVCIDGVEELVDDAVRCVIESDAVADIDGEVVLLRRFTVTELSIELVPVRRCCDTVNEAV